MTFISSVLSNQGFTPLPVETCPSIDFCGAGRGLFFTSSGTVNATQTPSIILK